MRYDLKIVARDVLCWVRPCFAFRLKVTNRLTWFCTDKSWDGLGLPSKGHVPSRNDLLILSV